MVVYVILHHGNSPDLGDWIEGVFSTREKAQAYIDKYLDFYDTTIEGWDLDSGHIS